MGFTKHALDLFISEKIGQVTKCGATRVAKEFPSSDTWVSTFGLCVIFQNYPPAHNRQVAFQFIRRIEMAFAEYTNAVEYLEDLVSGESKRWSPYFHALYHFEASICQLYLAYDGMRKKLGTDYFQSGDLSNLDRLNKIYDASKHESPTAEQPLWIENEGISASKKERGVPEIVSISFIELEELLRSFGRIADKITNQGQS